MPKTSCTADSTFADLNDTHIISVKDGATVSLMRCDFLRNELREGDGGSSPKPGAILVEAGFAHNTGLRVERCKFENMGTDFRFVKNVGEEAKDGGYTGAPQFNS